MPGAGATLATGEATIQYALEYTVALLLLSWAFGVLTVVLLVVGVLLIRRGKGRVPWLGRALLCWSFLLIGLLVGWMLLNMLFTLGYGLRSSGSVEWPAFRQQVGQDAVVKAGVIVTGQDDHRSGYFFGNRVAGLAAAFAVE